MWQRVKSWFHLAPVGDERAYAADAMIDAKLGFLADALSRLLAENVSRQRAPTVLAGLTSAMLLSLDECLRYGTWLDDPDADAASQPTPPFGKPREVMAAYLFAAGCDASGYIRQRSLASIGACPGHPAMALALIRCDDWVAPVREEAMRLLEALTAIDPGALLEYTDLLVALRGRERVAGSAWPRVIAPVLSRPELAAARWRATRRGGTDARLLAYSLIAAVDAPSIGDACRQAVADDRPRVALWALRQARVSLSRDEGLSVARLAVAHPHVAVRAEALRMFAELAPGDSRTMLEQALFDPAESPRRVAAHHLRELFGVDAKSHWRAALDAGDDAARTRTSLLALAGNATGDDRARIEPWLADARAPVRLAALRAYARTGVPDLPVRLQSGLVDPSLRVVRVALRLYEHQPGALTAAALRQAYASAATPGAKSLLVHAVVRIDKWAGLELLLEWAGATTADAEALLAGGLTRWIGQARNRFTALDVRCRARLESACAQARRMLPGADWDELDAIIRSA